MLGRSKRKTERQGAPKREILPCAEVTAIHAREDALSHPDIDSRRIFAAAMVGQFVCVFCSHPGPHDDIGHGQGSEIAFSCSRCGKHLDEAALKRSVVKERMRS